MTAPETDFRSSSKPDYSVPDCAVGCGLRALSRRFVIHAYGEKLAIDGGYYDWWGSPHFNAYSMTTLAHNTLLVDGTGQPVRKPGADGRITTYFDSPGYVVVHDLVASAAGIARYD